MFPNINIYCIDRNKDIVVESKWRRSNLSHISTLFCIRKLIRNLHGPINFQVYAQQRTWKCNGISEHKPTWKPTSFRYSLWFSGLTWHHFGSCENKKRLLNTKQHNKTSLMIIFSQGGSYRAASYLIYTVIRCGLFTTSPLYILFFFYFFEIHFVLSKRCPDFFPLIFGRFFVNLRGYSYLLHT